MLGVSRSGYYAWVEREPSARDHADEQLGAAVEAHFKQGRHVYGTRRLKASLAAEGVEVSRRRIGRLMDSRGLAVKTKRKFKPTSTACDKAEAVENLLSRQFEVDTPDTAYVGDITYVWTDEGWLYLAVVIDLYSRAVVGWAMSQWQTAELVNRALAMALSTRRPPPGLVMHTDQGSQYTAKSYRQLAEAHQVCLSMSGRGVCWDNAVAESFFHSLKTECLYQQRLATREQAKGVIFDYIEVFYNRQRRHSTLGYQAPLVYEHAQLATAAVVC